MTANVPKKTFMFRSAVTLSIMLYSSLAVALGPCQPQQTEMQAMRTQASERESFARQYERAILAEVTNTDGRNPVVGAKVRVIETLFGQQPSTNELSTWPEPALGIDPRQPVGFKVGEVAIFFVRRDPPNLVGRCDRWQPDGETLDFLRSLAKPAVASTADYLHPKNLSDTSVKERQYCGAYVSVCRLCAIDGPTFVFDRRTGELWGSTGMGGFICYPQDRPAADCSAIRQLLASESCDKQKVR